MHRAIATLLVALAVAPLLWGGGAAAQGVLRGTVHDREGAPIRGAAVVVRGTTLATETDLQGRFRLPVVPAGAVRVHAAAIGYSFVDTTVALTGGDSTTIDIALSPAPLALPPVDVISEKVPHFGDRPPTSVAQVTEQDLNRRAVTTVDEAVDHAPGVQFVNGQINLRGSTGYVQGLNSRVLMTVDGVPMNQGDRGGINWDLLAVDEIESVQILKGAGSSLYGSAAFGGVVNVTTRDIPNGLHTRMRFTGGMYGDPPHLVWRFRDNAGLLGSGDVTASYGTDELGGRISAGDRHSDGYRQQDQDDHLHFAGKARWQPSVNTRVDVSGAWAVDRYDVPLSWCSRGECDDRGQVFQPFKVDTSERGARTDSRKGYLAAQVRTTVSPQLAWVARGSWMRTHFTDLRRTATEFGVGNRFGAEGRIEVTGVQRGREAIGGLVREADAVVLRVERDRGQDRAEDLLAGDLEVVGPRREQRRGDEVAVAVGRLATCDELRPLGLARLDVSGDALELLGRYQRSHLRALVEAGADLRAGRALGQGRDDLVEVLLRDEEPGAGVAGLAGVEVDRGPGPLHGGVEVGVGQDDVG